MDHVCSDHHTVICDASDMNNRTKFGRTVTVNHIVIKWVAKAAVYFVDISHCDINYVSDTQERIQDFLKGGGGGENFSHV